MASAKASSNQNQQLGKTRAVISHAFCDSSVSAKDKIGKKSLDEVHTYAELKHDPRALLPDSFTICSTIMTTSNCPSSWYTSFFTLLDNNKTQLLAPAFKPGSSVSILKIYFLKGSSDSAVNKIPPLFPNQWTRSCVAINTTSGSIQWVVEGTLLMNTTSEEVKNSKNHPRNLGKKIILGSRYWVF